MAETPPSPENHPAMPSPPQGAPTSAAEWVAQGLPALAPDFVEQDHPDEMDNIVPTHGYQMLPMVGLGGSAGSITALQQFFKTVPPEPGMAFVVIIHLAPEHSSTLDSILGAATSMTVVPARDAQKVEANTVYVIPPGKLLTAANGHLKLTDLEPERGKRVAVDLFFRSLADTHGPHATAIILSGADGDGALGIKRVKERGGLTIAQDPEQAEHPEHAALRHRHRHGGLGAAGGRDGRPAAGVSAQRSAPAAPFGRRTAARQSAGRGAG